jgi:hypothetical protein
MLSRVLKSIESVADEIIVVAPKYSWGQIAEASEDISIKMVDDPGTGLAGAINEGFRNLGEDIEFANWIGDDDGIYPEQFVQLKQTLENSNAVAVFGDCDYKLENGTSLGRSSAGDTAVKILSWGPDLIPQPTALFHLDALRSVGLVDETYKLAFDYDLFLKLKALGPIKHFPEPTGYFTWHADSLSVSNRFPSAKEAHDIRMKNAKGFSKLFIGLISPLVILATVFAGFIVNMKAKRVSKGK